MPELPIARLNELEGNQNLEVINVYPEWVNAGLSDNKANACLAVKLHSQDVVMNIIFPVEAGPEIIAQIQQMLDCAKDPNFKGHTGPETKN